MEAAQLPEGVRIDRIEVTNDAAIAHVFIRAADRVGSESLSLVGSIKTDNGSLPQSSAKHRASGSQTHPGRIRRKRTVIRLCAWIMFFSTLLAASGKIVRISVYPQQANLTGDHTRQSLLVMAVDDEGVERDVTAKAAYTTTPAGSCA